MNRQKLFAALFSKRFVTEDGHWLWIGCTDKDGYGKVGTSRRQYRVHRLSAHLFLGLDLSNSAEQANHRTDLCSYKHCFHPDHLYVGDVKSNNADTLRDGHYRNGRATRTHCSNGHQFTDDNVYRAGTRRQCRECHRIHGRNRYLVRKLAKALLVG